MWNFDISIIVPIYNTEDYLRDCIESILRQKLNCIQIILVDDGSNDNSGKICDEYAAKYENIFVYHIDNQGLGPARNYGVSKASGKYILFLDSDDYYEENTLKYLFEIAEKNNADAVYFDFIIDDYRKGTKIRLHENSQYIDTEVFVKAKMNRCTLPSSCLGMYKLEKWKESSIIFPKVPYEDNAVFPLILNWFVRYVIIDEGVYHYRINHRKTITRNSQNDMKRTEPLIYLMKMIGEENKNYKFDENDLYRYCYNQLGVSEQNVFNSLDEEEYCIYLENANLFLNEYFPNKQGLKKREYRISVSIIVPVHNSEKYLEECLNSLVSQRYRDFEVIIIEDNSVDGTRDIIDYYVKKDRRIQVVYDDNSSYGHKINLGIGLARGKYFTILESDDFYTDETLECLVYIAESNSVDYVDCDFIEFKTIGNKYYYSYTNKYDLEQYNKLILGYENHNALSKGTSAIWTGLYNKNFVIENSILLNESEGASYQDVSFRFLVCAIARKSYHIQKGLYFYRKDNDNSSVNDSTKVFNIVNEYKYLKNELQIKGQFYGDLIGYYYIWKYTGYFWNAKRLPYELNKEFVPYFLKELKMDDDNLKIVWEQFRHDIVTTMRMFQINPYKLLEEVNQSVISEENKNKKLMKYAKIVQQNKAIIFGCGKWGKELLDLLKNERDNIICFCDNNESNWGNYIDGIKVLDPNTAITNCVNAKFVVAAKGYENQIIAQLEFMGVDKDNIIIYNHDI